MLHYAKRKAKCLSLIENICFVYLLLLQKPKKPPPPVKSPGMYDVHADRCLCESSSASSKMQKQYMTSEEDSEVALYFSVLKLPLVTL